MLLLFDSHSSNNKWMNLKALRLVLEKLPAQLLWNTCVFTFGVIHFWRDLSKHNKKGILVPDIAVLSTS